MADKPSLTSPKSLPRNGKILDALLHAANKNLDFLEPYHNRQILRLKELRKAFAEPQQILQRSSFLQAITEASNQHFAQGGPSISVLAPFIDSTVFQDLLAKHANSRARIRSLLKTNPSSMRGWRPCIVAFGELVTAEGAIVDFFRSLQQRIISAIEKSAADTSEDNRRPSRVKLPKNPKVIFLAKKINENRDQELSENDIATQFTEGDEKRAANLLRQLRRYPHLRTKRRQ